MGLAEYKRKRDFKKTPEPRGKKINSFNQLSYVIQRHAARRLHYDFRLELDGVLKSWAIPKGPSLDPKVKRLAVETEDHPLEYAQFEGMIPKGEYGAGTVEIWDRGTWKPIGDPRAGFEKGHLHFELVGEKLTGEWNLVRTKGQGDKHQWLLIKRKQADPPTVPVGDLTRDTTSKIQSLKPQLAVLATRPPEGDDWIHEIKFDGYRTLCHMNGKDIKLLTRSALDWTEKYKILLPDLKRLPVKSAWFDGEIVCLDPQGRSNFQLLQESLKKGGYHLRYYVFDMPELNGEDLRERPLIERKKLLKKILDGLSSQTIVYSEHFEQKGQKVLNKVCQMGLEGIISKNKNSPYVSYRDKSWIKVKCGKGQEFVVGGYTEPKNTREGFGSLILGAYNEDGELTYTGRVGTGFTQSAARDLMARFKKISRNKTPFTQNLPAIKTAHWLKPQLVAEVNFLEWTRDGILRQPAFKGLRFDKPAREVRLEKPVAIDIEKFMKNGAATGARFKISNSNKILIPKSKVTKGEIALYYQSVQEFILPHIVDRPLAVLRCPDGIKKECFFQKKSVDFENIFHKRLTDPDGDENEVIYIKNAPGLSSLCQAGVIEIHPWGSRIESHLFPDTVVFDMDPGPGVSTSVIAESALHLKDILEQLSIRSFAKVTGGKGYHVQIPISPRYDWAQIKNFARTVVTHMAQVNPKLYVTNMSKSKRKGKIFLDYLRNGYGATAVAAYSVRAREEASVALPITWSEITKVHPNQYNVRDAIDIVKNRPDPWKEYFKIKQRISILEPQSS